jgi:hypothetical protein
MQATQHKRVVLSTLWLFATLNYLYCDVVTLMDPTLLKQFLAGNIGGIEVSQAFLLAAGALVEIPIAMVFLARVLPDRFNPWANILAGVVMTLVQALSVVGRLGDGYYLFFSAFEILATASVVFYAARWIRERRASGSFGSADGADLDPVGGVATSS